MENHERRIVGDGEFDLPEEIIQRIQSFLNGREAAQTTLLSKFWRSAWSTRPNLDFYQQHFRQREQFADLATKTMQRYEDLNLKIQSFRLQTSDRTFNGNELMAKAIKLGAFDLDINLGQPQSESFVLPDEVLRSETLTRLSLSGGLTIDLVRLTCFKLKSLRLINVYVNDNCDLFRDLLSRLPLLGRLEFKGIRFPDDKYEDGELKLKLEYDEFHHKLEYLDLQDLRVDSNLIISSNFPFLKDLVIGTCSGLRNIRICSESLERISIQRFFFSLGEDSNSWDTELYVPNIRKIKLEGYGWSRLDLETSCTKWESNIVVDYLFDASPESFISLNKALDQLSLSGVCLYLLANLPNDDCSGVVGAAGLPSPPPVVERLKLVGDNNEVNAAFLDNLFLICRPKLIARRWLLPIPSDPMASNKRKPIPRDDPTFKNLSELIRKRVVVEDITVEGIDDLPLFGVVCFHLRYNNHPADIPSPLSLPA